MDSLKIIFRFLFREKKILPITSTVIIILSTFVVVFPLYTLFMIEHVIPAKDIKLMNISLVVMLVIVGIRFFLHIIQDAAFLVLRVKIEKGIMHEYIRNVFLLKWSELNAMDQGILTGRLNIFLSDIYWFLSEFIYFIFYALYLLMGLLIWMFFINKWLFIVMVFFLPLHFFNILYFSRKIKESSIQFVEHYNVYNSFIHQVLSGLIEIRTNFMNNFFAQLNTKNNDSMLKPLFWKKNYSSIQNSIQIFLISLNTAIVLCIGTMEISRGRLQKGDLVFFLLLMSFFYEPVYRLLRVNEMMQVVSKKIKDLYEIINSKKIEIDNKPAALSDKPDVLKLERIIYQVAGRFLFHEASYNFSKGNIYMLSGPSGTGKTTLFNIIAGLIEDYEGTVSLDRISQKENSLANWRSKIGYAFQYSYFFRGTILSNIILGNKASDHQKLESAKYQAVLDYWTEDEGASMDYPVEEQGKNLSGGQQQRIQLARIFYQDAPIMLLDEPTASLDVHTEWLFFKRLQEIKKNKIILIITHNDQNHKYADVVVKLSDGKLERQS